MKRLFPVLFSMVALLGFATAIVWARPPSQGKGPDLVPTNLSLNPQVPYPGQKVEFTLEYENQGDAAVPATAKVKYHLEVKDVGDVAEGKVPEDKVANLGVGRRGEVTGIFYAPAKKDTHVIVSILDIDGMESSPLETTLVIESALPTELAQLFAGLGVFAAVMAIMAVGTEVMPKPIKSFLGMKQKVSAMETFDQLKQELPGQLAGLGVDAKQLEEIKALFDSLGETLKPVEDINQAIEAIKGGLFGEAITVIEEMEDLIPEDADVSVEAETKKLQDRLETSKVEAKVKVREGFAAIRDKLHLSSAIVGPIETSIETQLMPAIENVTLDDLKGTASVAGRGVLNIAEQLQKTLADPTWAKNWLDSQTDTFEKSVKAKLDSAARFAQLKMTTYTEAVRKLLMAVEKRRQEMQSPARKTWRRLRKSDQLSFWGTLVGLVIGIAGLVLACWPGLFTAFLLRVLIAIATAVIGGFVAWLASWLILRTWRDSLKLGQVLECIEELLNKIRGRESRFGKVDSVREKKIEDMGPTSIAAVTLELDDFHRDEEISRLRLLRAFSIVVGITLAYWLKIDAADYLNYAIPGIAGRINNAVHLHQIWSPIPEELTVGIILTGLAASAGSKFWRDLLGRLQTARGQAEEAARHVRKVRGRP